MLPIRESEKALQDELYKHGGSWACVLRIGEDWRMYGDPFHSLPIVYHADLNLVASSTSLIPTQYKSKNQVLTEALNIPEESNWYPFGLTPYYECRRLLPNHYLRLSTNEAVRHWPSPDTFSTFRRGEARSILVEQLSRNIRAFARDGHPYLSLTAGRDSRVLLACSKGVQDQITCHTIQLPDKGGQIDYQVARYITSKFGFEHEAQSYLSPHEDDLEEWLDRTGCCAAGQTWRNVTTVKQLDSSRARLGGIGGEIGRAYYHKATDDTETKLGAEEIASRLHLPATQQISEAAEAWMEGVPTGIDGFDLLDLLYIEQRIGCWASVTSLGHANSAYYIFPFCDRKVVQALVSLDEKTKRSEEWMVDIIESTWPELLQIPFDRWVGWPRVKKAIQKRLTPEYVKSVPDRVWQNVRQYAR